MPSPVGGWRELSQNPWIGGLRDLLITSCLVGSFDELALLEQCSCTELGAAGSRAVRESTRRGTIADLPFTRLTCELGHRCADFGR